MVHVQVDGETEDDELHHGRHEEQDAHARLAQYLNEFFAKDD
jgi:hypothetical protein